MTETDFSTFSNRELCGLAILDWDTPWFGAVPYIDAMADMISCDKDPVVDRYYDDTPGEIVQRFLGNAAQWRGPVARGVKAELKKRLRNV